MKVTIPWYIMTSKENNSATVNFFEEHKYFGYQKDIFNSSNKANYQWLGEDGKSFIG